MQSQSVEPLYALTPIFFPDMACDRVNPRPIQGTTMRFGRCAMLCVFQSLRWRRPKPILGIERMKQLKRLSAKDIAAFCGKVTRHTTLWITSMVDWHALESG